MKKYILIPFVLLAICSSIYAQEPLYIVNGQLREEIRTIPPEQIESIETLPADEQAIERYGPRASNGVLLITLCHDRAAEFSGGVPFGDYVASQVRWTGHEPAARVILRYTVTEEGRTVVDKELESTDSRLKRRVLKAIAEAPLWIPASKNGTPVESQGVLHIQLPEGKPLPRQVELVWR